MVNRKKIIEEIIDSFRLLKRKIMEEKLESGKCPITFSQAQILFIVLRQKNISVKELAEKLAISSSAVVQLIEELVKNGYLVRKNNPKDHRFVQIAPSEKTITQIKKFKSRFLKKVAALFDDLSDNELLQYHKLNKKILKKDN
jgi:DNA-binding MarR family transcriptional regulator